MPPRLIFNADDLGLAGPVNAAIEQAHREGVLTAASLMVGEPAAAEGVEVARRNPRLAVGLHLTLTDGTPTLPPERIPALVQANGRFRDDMAGLGLSLAVSRAARAQLRAEIAAQCAAFRATGLECDHLNAHKHYHLHPVIAAVAFAEAARMGVRAVRIPYEPGVGRALAPLILWLRRLAARHGLRAPDRVVGLGWTGAFTVERLAGALTKLPPGVTELYFHPATEGGFPGAAPGYRYAEELATLVDAGIRTICARLVTGGYAAMLA